MMTGLFVWFVLRGDVQIAIPKKKKKKKLVRLESLCTVYNLSEKKMMLPSKHNTR